MAGDRSQPRLRVRLRTYCYGCRAGNRWRKPLGQRRDTPTDRSLCVWRSHRFEWEYAIMLDGLVVAQRGYFSTREKAERSAQRKYEWLTSLTTA